MHSSHIQCPRVLRVVHHALVPQAGHPQALLDLPADALCPHAPLPPGRLQLRHSLLQVLPDCPAQPAHIARCDRRDLPGAAARPHRACPLRPATAATRSRSRRHPPASSTTAGPPASATPSTSVASARIVPGEPSGSSITSSSSPFTRLNDLAATGRPDSGCVLEITRTTHGSTARRCCSLSPSLPASSRPTSPPPWALVSVSGVGPVRQGVRRPGTRGA